jgi:hypothetical protein
MSTAFTSAGTTIQISAVLPSPYSEVGFEAVTGWQTIGEVTDLGEFGRTYNLVTHNPLGDRRTVKRKGSYNDGTVAMTVARDPSDAGQAIAIEALDSDNSYSFLVTLQDGTELYFTAQVMSYTTNVGSVDQITTAAVSLEIDNDIIEVEGSA